MKDQTTLNYEKRIANAASKEEKAQRELKKAQQEQKNLTRAARTHRLCVLGGLVEKYLLIPDVFDADDVERLLKKTWSADPTLGEIKLFIEKKSRQKVVFKNNKYVLELPIEEEENEAGETTQRSMV